MKKTTCFGFILFFILSASLVVQAEKLDPALPPTDDLDYEEIQKKIAVMLPETPELLKFSAIHTFRFSGWPEGLQREGNDFSRAMGGYSLKTDGTKVYLLDKPGKTVFAFDTSSGRQQMVATDRTQPGLQMDAFAIMRDNGIAIADNSRNALLFFKNSRLLTMVDYQGDRGYFRHIEFIEADRLGLNLAVYDSGRDRSYVFSGDGRLQWESPGRSEPGFMGNSLLKLQKSEKYIEVQRYSSINQTPTTFSTYRCDAGNIILDAWVAGTFGGKLAVVVYEGRGDEDHPDYARLVVIQDEKITVKKFVPNFDMRLSMQPPYRLLMTRKGLLLVTARLANEGIEIIAADVPQK